MKRAAPSLRPVPAQTPQRDGLVDRHLRAGWRALLVFVPLGLILEALHGFKVRWYLDVSNETRRLMWTLAHAHGTLLALLNIAFAATLALRPARHPRRRALASACLLGATVALPAGFLLGGLVIHDGDPGLGIVLVPAGGALLMAAVALTAA
jgi:peptidoglycan/LPS O-acetylase OafA/YrhL